MNIINKLQIGEYIINQPFYHSSREINCRYPVFSFDINPFSDDEFIEYVFVVIHTKENLQGIDLGIQFDAKDLRSRQDYTYFNKIYPLEYEKSYDVETNTFLENITRNNISNVLFMPLEIPIRKKAFRSITIPIYNCMFMANIDFYFKITSISHIDKQYSNKLIEQYFDSDPEYGKHSTIEPSRYGDFITNFYLLMEQDSGKKHIKNYYKLYNKLVIIYGGYTVSEIPLDYVVLYLTHIKNIDIRSLSHNGKHILPINLHELINISHIPFHSVPNITGIKIQLCPNDISKFHYNVRKTIKYNTIDISYDAYINYIPVDIWGVILEYLDCVNILSAIETCKFFYSLVSQKKIDNLYNACKITIEDLVPHDINMCIMYHGYKNKIIPFNPESGLMYQFMLNSRSIIQYEIIIEGIEYIFNPDKLNPISYIIIEVDIAGQYDILDMNKMNCMDGIIKDVEFYSKMHNPKCNRYVIYPSTNNINFVFKEYISAKANIYVAYDIDPYVKNWIQKS